MRMQKNMRMHRKRVKKTCTDARTGDGLEKREGRMTSRRKCLVHFARFMAWCPGLALDNGQKAYTNRKYFVRS